MDSPLGAQFDRWRRLVQLVDGATCRHPDDAKVVVEGVTTCLRCGMEGGAPTAIERARRVFHVEPEAGTH